MIKMIDKLKGKYKRNKKLINMLTITTIIGIIFGSILIVLLNQNDKSLVKEYIVKFMDKINGKVDFIDIFKNSFFSNLMYILIIWILGISLLGIPAGILICFFKGFIYGFSFSSFILTYKLKGILIGVIANMPYLLNILIIIALAIYSIKFSYVLINILLKKITINFKNIFNIYLNILLIAIVYIFLSSIVETFIPSILKTLVFLTK